jgi:pimeloyl-[acyl-carrier protein] methyl ester esterase
MTKIHTEIMGEGPVLVMIHGWSMHSGVWQSFARQLARRFKVICLDLPGHGRSDYCQPYQLQTLGDALLAAVDDPHFTLLGWSLGASVAIDMAHRYPERIDRLIILAGNPCFVEQPGWPGVNAKVLAMFSDYLQDKWQQTLIRFMALQVNGLPESKKRLKQLKNAFQQAPAPDQEALKAGLKILKEADLRKTYQSLNQPVLALFAGQDNLIPIDCMNAMKQLKPALKTGLLEEAGHAPFLSHAREIEMAIQHFMGSCAE